MIMTTVDLADRIELKEITGNHIQILSHNRFVPDDHRNLAYQAAFILKERFGINKGVSITIEKNIPVAAGLAGGSSDAAATLRGLNRLWKLVRHWPEGAGKKSRIFLHRQSAGSSWQNRRSAFRLPIYTKGSKLQKWSIRMYLE